jgi:transposase
MRRGRQAIVAVSGRNSRVVPRGAVNVATGELAAACRARLRGEDSVAFLEELARVRPGAPKLLLWDNAPPHRTRAARAAAEAGGIQIAWLPFRSPELNPVEDLWRGLKRSIAANRAYASVDELAERSLAYFKALGPEGIRRSCGLLSGKFNWLPT